MVNPVVTTAKTALPKSISTCAVSSAWTWISSPSTTRSGRAVPVMAITRVAGPNSPVSAVTL